MKTKKYFFLKSLVVAMCLFNLVACREDGEPLPKPETVVIEGLTPEPFAAVKTLYVLNQGVMGENKTTIDRLDFRTSIYSRNLYPYANPTEVMGLGDVGNDMAIYRNRLYVVLNGSNLVEVIDAQTLRHIGAVEVPNCRYIAFDSDYAYVTSYANSGYVTKISLATLQRVGDCAVGREPEGLAVAGGKLYVANSGGYGPLSGGNYDHTVSVIDLATFTETKKIEVNMNPQRVIVDSYGKVWVNSTGNYGDVPSRLEWIDTATDERGGTLDTPVSGFCIDGDRLYFYATVYNPDGSSSVSFGKVNVLSKTLLSGSLITDGTAIAAPYAIAVHPITKELYLTDAGDYVNPGKLLCFSSQGVLQWSVRAGDVPAQLVFE